MFEHLLRIIAAALTAEILTEDEATSLRTTVEAMGADETKAGVTADQLTSADEALVELFGKVRTGDVEGIGSDDVEGLREMGDMILALRSESVARAEQAAAREAELADIAAKIAPTPEADADAEGDADAEAKTGDEPEAKDGEDADAKAAAEVVAEAEAAAKDAAKAEPVAASLAGLKAAQPKGSEPTSDSKDPGYQIVTPAGAVVASLDELAALTAEAFSAASGAPVTASMKQRLAQVRTPHPEHRRLYGERSDAEKLEAVLADAGNPDHWTDAVIASGGFCAPADVDYSVPTVGVEDRPVRDGLPSFGLPRGAVTVQTPPSLASITATDGVDVDAAVTVWTNATDITPGASTKGVQTIDCSGNQDFTAAAIVRRLRWGNFGAMAHPENVEAWNRLAIIAHARLGDSRLLDQIKAASTAKTTPQTFGAARDLAEAIARAAAQIRSLHRMQDSYRFRVLLPEWAITLGSVDLMRGLQSERSFVTDAEAIFREMLSDAGVNVTLYKDTPSTGTSQILAVGAGATLNGWPTEVQWGLFPEGRFAFGNMEQLNLGIYRSPELNDTNDVENFAETFEVVIDHGQADAVWVTSTVCADGASGAGVDVAVCAS